MRRWQPCLLHAAPADVDAAFPSKGVEHVVLSRALVRSRRFALGHLPVAQRRAALRAQTLAWAPFDQSAYRLLIQGEHAIAFAWDEQKVNTLLTDAGWLRPGKNPPSLWPEVVWQPPMTPDGLRAVSCVDGLDYQFWQDGKPVSSRWWAQVPSVDDWLNWTRTLPQGVTGAPPPARVLPLLARPWASLHDPIDLQSSATPRQRWAVLAAVWVMTVASGMQARETWLAHQDGARLSQERTRLQEQTAPVGAARRQATAAAAEGMALAALLTGLQPLELLKHLSDPLAGVAVTLTELELTPERVSISVEPSGATQRAAVVNALQDGGVFDQVAQARDAALPTWWRFDMRLKASSTDDSPTRTGAVRGATGTDGATRKEGVTK